MKRKITALCLALLLLVMVFPIQSQGAERSPAEELPEIPVEAASELTVIEETVARQKMPDYEEVYRAIIPAPNMKDQHAVLGQTMALDFYMYSSYGLVSEYLVYVFQGTEIDEERVVAFGSGKFKDYAATYFLTLGWDTSVNAAGAGDYLVVASTIHNGEVIAVYEEIVTLTEEYIPLEYIYLIDAESGQTVSQQSYDYSDRRVYTIGYYPPNASTPDRRNTCAVEEGEASIGGFHGEVFVNARTCGKTVVSVTAAEKTARLELTVAHQYRDEYGYCLSCMELIFEDVSPDAWYHDSVEYVALKQLMCGMGKGLFAPDSPMTRAQLVTILWRSALYPVGSENYFDDVGADLWYTQAVAWAAENEIVKGVGNGRFDPEGEVSREQLVTILYRYSIMCGQDVSQREDLSIFPDADEVSPWALEAMQWAVAEGLITGNAHSGNTWLEPQSSATRGQVAVILQRYMGGS